MHQRPSPQRREQIDGPDPGPQDIAVVRLGPAGRFEGTPVRGGAAVRVGRGRVGPGRQQPAHEIVPLAVHGDVEGGGLPVERPAVDRRAVVEQIVDDIGGADVDRRPQRALVVRARAHVSDRGAGLDEQAHQPEVADAGGADQRGRPVREPEPRLEALNRRPVLGGGGQRRVAGQEAGEPIGVPGAEGLEQQDRVPKRFGT